MVAFFYLLHCDILAQNDDCCEKMSWVCGAGFGHSVERLCGGSAGSRREPIKSADVSFFVARSWGRSRVVCGKSFADLSKFNGAFGYDAGGKQAGFSGWASSQVVY